MKRNTLVFSIIISAVVGLVLAFLWALICTPSLRNVPLWLLALTGIIAGLCMGGTFVIFRHTQRDIEYDLENLPLSAAEYIKSVIKYMRYRRIARQQVADELTDHFEQHLKDCKTIEEKDKIARRLITEFGDAKLLAILMRRAKKRCRPLWRTIAARTLQTTALLLICLVIYVVWFLSGKPVVTTDYIAQINQITRPCADDSINAAPLYNKAFDSFVDVKKASELLRIHARDANDKQKEFIRHWLARNQAPLALVTKGSQLPYFWKHYRAEDPNEGTLSIMLPNLALSRCICYALCWRAWLSAEEGDINSALCDIETCYRFGRHNKGEKSIVGQLIGMAIERRALSIIRFLFDSYKISSENLVNFQKHLRLLIDTEDFRMHFGFEKLFLYDEVQRCFTGGRFGPSHLYPRRLIELESLIQGSNNLLSGDNWLIEMLARSIAYSTDRWLLLQIFFTQPDETETIATANNFYKYMDEIAVKTPVQLHAEGIDPDDEYNRIAKKNLILRIFTAGFGNFHRYTWRNKIDAECTLVIIALIRYRQDTGSYPDTLDDIVKNGYLEKIPIDPFSGAPIAYRKTNDDFLLYSFGEDLDDDGGQPATDKQGNPKNWGHEGDWLFWPVEKI